MLRKLLLILLLILLVLLRFSAEPVRIFSTTHCPYTCNDLSGVAFELLDDFLKGHNLKSERQIAPWVRLLQSTKKQGMVDIMAPAIPIAAPHLWYPKTPLFYDTFCFYKKKSNTWRYQRSKILGRLIYWLLEDMFTNF